jgi:hypothetical protein
LSKFMNFSRIVEIDASTQNFNRRNLGSYIAIGILEHRRVPPVNEDGCRNPEMTQQNGFRMYTDTSFFRDTSSSRWCLLVEATRFKEFLNQWKDKPIRYLSPREFYLILMSSGEIWIKPSFRLPMAAEYQSSFASSACINSKKKIARRSSSLHRNYYTIRY